LSLVFRIAAPLFKRSSRRWTADDFRWIASKLRPFVAPGGSFLDLGGGTGELGTGIAVALDAQVVIADHTQQMLDLVTPHPLVSTILASAEALPFPDGHFDAVFCCDAFHHFRHQDAAAAEMARVVRPGGAVLLLEMRPDGWGRLLRHTERLLGEPGHFHAPAALERLLATHGIDGASEGQGGISYLYLGTKRYPTA
jgi:ubiquinone/menaquinone biosynthesis C-methylase UbiE